MNQNSLLAATSIDIAQRQIGVKEATGKNDGKQVAVYQDYIGKWVEGEPWCAAFASWCIGQAAAKLGITTLFKKSAGSTEIWAQAKKNGTTLTSPIPYCIGLIRAPAGSGKTHEHTFRVNSVDLPKGIVHSIDGNWSNQVMETAHPISRCDFVAVC